MPSVNSMPPLLQHLRTSADKLALDIQANPRLQLGLALIAMIAIVVGLLNLNDRKAAAGRQLEALLTETAGMRKQLGSPARQAQQQARLQAVQAHIEKAFWYFPTPVVAQAEFGDWLSNGLRDAGVHEVRVSQPSFRFMDPSQDKPTADSHDTNPACSSGHCDLIELRTSIRFPFDPATFGKALALIEGAEKQTLIEQMTVNANDRHVELTVTSLAKMAAAEPAETPEPAAAATTPEATAAGTVEQASPETPKKVVEVKW